MAHRTEQVLHGILNSASLSLSFCIALIQILAMTLFHVTLQFEGYNSASITLLDAYGNFEPVRTRCPAFPNIAASFYRKSISFGCTSTVQCIVLFVYVNI